MNTTLNKIKEHDPYEPEWRKLLAHLGKTEADDEPLPFVTILESNGIEEAIWSLLTCEDERAVRLFACDVAESVLHLFEDKFPDDNSPRKAIEVSRMFANGDATKEELREASAAASWAAKVAWDVDASWAARAAEWAVEDEEGAVENAAWAARDAAWAVEEDAAAGDAERAKQKELFIKYFG